MGRRIVVRKDDVLVYKGFEIETDLLEAIVNPEKRVLWAFVKQGALIQLVPYDESKCIWLTEEDISAGIEA